MGKIMLDKAFVGSSEVDKIYLGAEIIYENKPAIKPDGAYIVLNDWSEVTLDEYKNLGKPYAKGVLVACDERKLMIDYKMTKSVLSPMTDFGNNMMTTTSEDEAATDMNGLLNCMYAFNNSPYFKDFVVNMSITSPDGVNPMHPMVISFGEAILLQMYGGQIYSIFDELGYGIPNMFWTSTRYNNEEFWFVGALDGNDHTTKEEAIKYMPADSMAEENDSFFLLPVYDIGRDWSGSNTNDLASLQNIKSKQ